MTRQLLAKEVVAQAVAARSAQLVCFGAACVIPVVALHRFSELELSEAQLLIAILNTLSVALLCTLLGLAVGGRPWQTRHPGDLPEKGLVRMERSSVRPIPSRINSPS